MELLIKKNVYASKLKLPAVFQKKKKIETLHLYLNIYSLTLSSWIYSSLLKMHPSTLEGQLNYLKCFLTMPLWHSNNLCIILCYQSSLLHCLSLTCCSLLPFLNSIWFFSYYFKNIEHLITLVNSYPAPRCSLIILITLRVSPSTNLRAWPWMTICPMDSVSFMQAATPVLAPTMLDAPSGPNLDLSYVQ